MARVMTPEHFRECPEGTVFAYGERWNFSSLMVLAEHVTGDGYWGFWAVDPMWVQTDDSGQAFDRLEEMLETGVSYPAEDAASKFMSYDGDKMEAFFILEKADIDALVATFNRK